MNVSKINAFIKNYGNNLDITIIIHLIIYVTIIYIFPHNNLLTNMLTIDSSIGAIRFIKTLYETDGNKIVDNYKNNEMTENDLIIRKLQNFIKSYYPNYNNKFLFLNEGKIKFVEKYFLFGLCQIFSLLVQTILWSFGSLLKSILNSLLLLIALPVFYIFITSSLYFITLLNKFVQTIKKIINYIMSKITAKIINKLTEATLNQNPKIDHVEILNYYEEFGSNILTTYNFTKTVIILSFVYYCKKTNNIFYYYLSDIIKKYQTDEILFSKFNVITDEEKQKKILTIIQERNWEEFLKPKTVNLIFELYNNKNENNEHDSFSYKIGIIIRNIKINFFRFMSLWSLAVIYYPLSILIDFYYTYIDNKFFIRNHFLSYIIGCILLAYNHPMYGSFFIITSDFLIKPLLEYIEENNIVTKYFIRNINQLKYLGILSSIYKIQSFGFIIPLIIYYFNKDIKITFITFLIIFLNYLSNFSYLHLLSLWAITSIINNILTINSIKDTSIDFNYIENYLQNPLSNVNIFNNSNIIKISEEYKNQKRKNKINRTNKNNICELFTNIFYIKN